MRTVIEVPLPGALNIEISPPGFREISGPAPGEGAANRVCAFNNVAFPRKWPGFTLQHCANACNLLEVELKM
ncbi:hypothetical protein P0D69_01355 [Paraburkholderia sediminicola]|uniref:hypothetical protein n=1 Tax=Paraburkholderia sediminicola TaxID=458836 RepID=UPI0038BC906B